MLDEIKILLGDAAANYTDIQIVTGIDPQIMYLSTRIL